MGAYKHNVVVVIKMGAYIYGVPILCAWVLIILILWYGYHTCVEQSWPLGHGQSVSTKQNIASASRHYL